MTLDQIFANLGTSPAEKPADADYKAGYRAFSEDDDGSVARAMRDHWSGKKPMDRAIYSEAWFYGYQDASDDFCNSQEGY